VLERSGRLGSGPTIQIRGRSSIGLENSPLIYIDGIRVNNATATGQSAYRVVWADRARRLPAA
jgi:outer membrane cobalamin receptor